jgi:hypothetical protein
LDLDISTVAAQSEEARRDISILTTALGGVTRFKEVERKRGTALDGTLPALRS